ncbi:MAG: hypothetical protein RL266_873 [Bacteroidota bacterium]|jgi:hypothetical protein
MRALLFVFLLSSRIGFAQEALLDSARKNIGEVFKTEAVCLKMHSAFQKADITGNNLLLGYKGAVELGMARHDPNPFNKMSFFSDGKADLEKAISKDPENLELRFLRLTIQTHIPSFLGYSDNKEADKAFVLNHLEEAKSETFKTKVRKFIAHAEQNGKL